MIRAVLDANVYVSAALRPQGPPAKSSTGFCGYPKVRKYIRPALDPELWFEDIIVLSHLVAGERDFKATSKDPDDDKYIAAAIKGRAGFVVAGDSDLLDLKQYEGIRIVSPRAFLDLLVA